MHDTKFLFHVNVSTVDVKTCFQARIKNGQAWLKIGSLTFGLKEQKNVDTFNTYAINHSIIK
jgi:hypothetical protein